MADYYIKHLFSTQHITASCVPNTSFNSTDPTRQETGLCEGLCVYIACDVTEISDITNTANTYWYRIAM
jgi:hypothetical protein